MRAGFHKYRYSSGNDKKIIFDLSRANNKVLGWKIGQPTMNAVEGFQQVHENKIYFYAQFDSDIENIEVSGNNKDSGMAVILMKNGPETVQ